jgi:hypothetical protein
LVVPRGFKQKTFERVHVLGPALGLNNVCWDEIPEPTPPPSSEEIKDYSHNADVNNVK